MSDSYVVWSVRVAELGTKELDKLLRKGYEPFGVIAAEDGVTDYIYLRRMMLVPARKKNDA